jgi:hypothetical protein
MNLPIYMYETRCITLQEKHIECFWELDAEEDFVNKMDEVTGGWRILHNEDLDKL